MFNLFYIIDSELKQYADFRIDHISEDKSYWFSDLDFDDFSKVRYSETKKMPDPKKSNTYLFLRKYDTLEDLVKNIYSDFPEFFI